MLLDNLKELRKILDNQKLDLDTIHDLLARAIFIQFLAQRKDSSGCAALNEEIFNDLYRTGILSQNYQEFAEILTDFDDTYQFFRWLNSKFNGDLFPGKGATEAEREAEWQAEIHKVKSEHLNSLANFIRGDLRMKDGQLCLWPQYSFDVIPLDFISSIYEEFVSPKTNKKSDQKISKGVHYTPEYIVDFILDGVLEWEGQEWDLKILDPACGSGIFLVKAFQRLVYRWKNKHQKKINPSDLRNLLQNNFFGVDINAQAVRVASFSLYLSMLDEIDPREYWENEVSFPVLRGTRLIDDDFFNENIKGLRTQGDRESYDLIIGNAPWGRNTVTKLAEQWAKKYEWETSYGNIAPFFLPKSMELAKVDGKISMMQPSGALIFNQIQTAQDFRQKLFAKFKIEEIVNLSALRFSLFKKAASPCCIITLSKNEQDTDPFLYICPKPLKSQDDDYFIVIEPQDISFLSPYEAQTDPFIWTALIWGGRRDLVLIRNLSKSITLEKLEESNQIIKRQGIIRGNLQKNQSVIVGRHILEDAKFLDKNFIIIDVDRLPINKDPRTDSRASTNFSAFEMPQMILKQSWKKKIGRFQAAISRSTQNQAALCSKSYVSIHFEKNSSSICDVACLTYNSKLAVYYLLLSSGRFASYRPEVNVDDLLRVPIPNSNLEIPENIKTYDDIDGYIRKAFEFKESEWTLIEDLFAYTLPDFQGNKNSPGRQPTHRKKLESSQEILEPELCQYCEYFIKVIKASFGQDKYVCATIFQEMEKNDLPIRLVAIHLNKFLHDGVKVESIDSIDLIKKMETLNENFIKSHNDTENSIFYQRVAQIYDSLEIEKEIGGELERIKIPTIYFVKPDRIRYWTRSMALRDADEVAADFMRWHTKFNIANNNG
ncbi:HsdM family class I SAM-dependent methyltransferase [Spirulina sp. 06S082]|uniref:HsdM family class I SAM-dependent methyltransferase n=1 Tax=Spirulina sp. 06S082 TaxID=3110248 RepID=UPI002B21F331|nr:N-6 DNA methylase [Spirulina sp. 06S082]MEA5472210.1 N-6 DNA methylase [Spirulina sp. 06S082]